MRSALHSLWLSYLAVERTGYRARSLTALAELLAEVASLEDRDALAVAAFRAHERHQLKKLREPLRVHVLRPYVQEHLAEPQAIWWALQSRIGDYTLLEAYLKYDRVDGSPVAGAITYALAVTGEPRWWRKLLNHRLTAVNYGTHHLDEGRGVVDGSVVEYVLLLCAAVAILNQAPAGAISTGQHDELVELWSLLRDWVRYDASGRPGGDFPQWTRAQGSDHWVARHTGTKHYYYRA
ncbi:MAG: hypothetical protein DLM55_10175 [Acidimicrobiales bacterium]|nr:MAG: hypothetical protein DLM55_10175 [Acidimicrobiales bacterium]